MSGIMLATVGQTSGSPPPSSLSATVFIQGGSSGVNVHTASGNSRNTPDGERFMIVQASGGTPPYSYLWQRQNSNPKTALESTTDQRAYALWNAMVVGEYASVTALCRVTDSTGAQATSNTHVIGFTRTI